MVSTPLPGIKLALEEGIILYLKKRFKSSLFWKITFWAYLREILYKEIPRNLLREELKNTCPKPVIRLTTGMFKSPAAKFP